MRPTIQLGLESRPSGLDTGIALHITIYISRAIGSQVSCCLCSWFSEQVVLAHDLRSTSDVLIPWVKIWTSGLLVYKESLTIAEMKVIKGESELPGDEQQVDNSNIGDPEIYEKNVCYDKCERIYAEAVIFIDDRLVRLIDVTMEQWLELKYGDQSTISNKIKENVIATWLVRSYKKQFEEYIELKKQYEIYGLHTDMLRDPFNKRGDDEEVLTNEEPYNLGEENTSERYEVTEICRIEVGLFEFKTPICDAFKECNYLSKVDVDVLTKDIPVFKTYEEYKDDWMYEWNDGIPWANEKPWTDDGEWTEPIGNSISYEDHEWYDMIEDSELKEEALINKRILEESMNMVEELRRYGVSVPALHKKPRRIEELYVISRRPLYADKMDNPDLTMKEYIELKAEKARRISFDESDDEDYIVMYNKDSFSYKLMSVTDFKTDSENGIDEVDLPHNNLIKQLDSDIDYNIDTQSLEFNKDFEINHDIHREPPNMEDYLIIIEVVIQKRFYEGMPLIFIIKNLYVPFGIPFDLERFYKDGVCTWKLQRLRMSDIELGLDEEMAGDSFEAYWVGSLRDIADKGDLRRGQAPEKVSATDLFYLRSMDEGTTFNIPYLLVQYLFRYAKGRKRGARMSGGYFVGRLLWLEPLKGTEGAPTVDEGVQAVLAPQPTLAIAPTKTMPHRISRLEEEILESLRISRLHPFIYSGSDDPLKKNVMDQQRSAPYRWSCHPEGETMQEGPTVVDWAVIKPQNLMARKEWVRAAYGCDRESAIGTLGTCEIMPRGHESNEPSDISRERLRQTALGVVHHNAKKEKGVNPHHNTS
ncbi:hypothetical protein Tco_0596432 [Tanacetum coccineum]